jgi:hypothetical protein
MFPMLIQNDTLQNQKHAPRSSSRSSMARVAVAAFVCLAMAGTASAGTVYSWQTDDGTYAYTDDRKRIPSRYRATAKSRSMGQLSSYKRFTESTLPSSDDYGKRLYARLGHLRDGGAIAMRAPGRGGASTGATFLVRTSGNRDGTTTQVGVPIDGPGSGPIFVDNMRVRADSVLGPHGSIATRHITVTRQGGRVISVSRPERNQRGLDFSYETDAIKGIQ